MATTYRVEMTGIYKSFGGIHALKDVSFRLKPGEIHALVGENGAGKSTLIKILSGAYQKDSGIIKIDGKVIDALNPYISQKLGIGINYQEFALAPDLTAAENIFMNKLSNSKGVIKWTKLYNEADELIKRLGFEIDSRTLVRNLSVAYQQVVEIAKALSQNVTILILDEPTAVLAPQEAEKLFEVLLRLKGQGVSIIYISHRLDEIFKIADTITVLKDGAVVDTVLPSEVNVEQIMSMMIGRTITTMFPRKEAIIGDEVFRVENLNIGNKVKNISFSVRSGEVLGIAGLVGSGRTEIARAIFGADKKETGEVVLHGNSLRIRDPREAVRHGIGLVPENRKEQGVILNLSICNNVTMPSIRKVSSILGVIQLKKEKDIVKRLVEKLAVKTKCIFANVGDLSGGNQQKVALAKWFSADCRVIILDEPTRGVDVGAKVEIYHLINELAKQGLGIIVISSEMIEIIGICDRVLVINNGRIAGILEREDITEENILRLAIGKRTG